MNLFTRTFSKIFKSSNQQELDKSVVIFLIWKMMRSNTIRPFIIRTMDEQLKNNKIVKIDIKDVENLKRDKVFHILLTSRRQNRLRNSKVG